jgi:hypothetical protein
MARRLVKVLDDDPIVKEIRDYRNLSHQFAGVIVTIHDTSTDAFIAHVSPPLDAKAPERNQQDASRNEQEIQKRELTTKLQMYQLGKYCEGLFRIIDAKYHTTVALDRSAESSRKIRDCEETLPEGAVIYVRVDGSAMP